ncbi:MAG: SET domain-containing protein-lysine N-methyltransferase [Bryobacteraceae bacterium]
MLVVQGCYTVIVNGERIPVKAGEEYLVPRGVPHSGEVLAGDQNDPCIWRPPGRPGIVMLLVKTYIDRSRIHGFGLFAAEPIPQRTPVWSFTPGFDLELPPSCLEMPTLEQRARLLHYGYLDPRLGSFILCSDDARFINHSDAPNISPDFTADRHGIDIAVREIAKGEEITAGYGIVEGVRPA